MLINNGGVGFGAGMGGHRGTAKFEASIYRFCPSRSCHDAIKRIFRYARSDSRRKWVFDVDIKGAFDHIDHSFLLEETGRFPTMSLLEQWLKAGHLEANAFYSTSSGTPQGGSCSLLLTNTALHGLEQAIGREVSVKLTTSFHN